MSPPICSRLLFPLKALWVVVFTLTALAAAQPAHAQSGDRIGSIRIDGAERIDDATVESYLTLGVGDPFDPARLDDSLKALFATGLFEDVAIDRAGDVLVVRVAENPVINRIAFEGNRRLEDDLLASEVGLRPRVVFSRARVQSAVSRIVELYRRSGRFAATVEPQVVELDQNRVDLIFEIQEGPLTGVGGIVFIGNDTFSDATLRGVIRTTESAFWRLLTSDDNYDPDRLAFDQELLRSFYLARGFADFRVVSAIAELSPDGSDFFITFTLDEGEVYDFGAINVETAIAALPRDEISPLITAREGETYNVDLIDESIDAITERLGELGFAFVEIEPIETRDTIGRTVGVDFSIVEGPRVFVERIDIQGNVRTLDEVIRREFRLAEGDAFNTSKVRRSQQRIRNLGFFESVEIRTEPGSAADRIRIVVDVIEQSTGTLSFGIGFSTNDGPLGNLRLSETNFLGRGQDLLANFTISGRRQDIEFSFTEPYFLGRELAAGVDVFSRRTDFQDEASFEEENLGATLRFGYPLTERLRHSVRYTLRSDDIVNVSDDASVFIQAEEGDRITSLVGQTFTYDTRDTRFLPSEGFIVRLDQDLAGVGGDNQFLRHELGADWYYSIVRDVVANLAFRGGYIFGWGGEDVRLGNRFFIGGSTFRGFQFGGLGPRDNVTDDSLGGNAYYVGTAELRFPLGLPEELRLFGRAFVEAGALTEIDVSGPSLDDSGDIRASAGVGLSWLSPLGPLAIDFSEAFVKDDGDKTESFRLSFGTRF